MTSLPDSQVLQGISIRCIRAVFTQVLTEKTKVKMRDFAAELDAAGSDPETASSPFVNLI